jgi:hypothetical protein
VYTAKQVTYAKESHRHSFAGMTGRVGV